MSTCEIKGEWGGKQGKNNWSWEEILFALGGILRSGAQSVIYYWDYIFLKVDILQVLTNYYFLVMENGSEPNLRSIIKLYKESIRNVPFLKYTWVIVATICILAISAYFQLKNTDVFIYAVIVLFFVFLGHVLSSLIKPKDKVIRIALYIFIYCLVLSMGATVLSFAGFVLFGKPVFYKTWFPPVTDTLKNEPKKTDTIFNPPVQKIEKKTDAPISIKTEQKKEIIKTSPQDNNIKEQSFPDKVKIAILPFDFVSNDEKYNWLSKGIPESLTNSLSLIDKYILIEGIQRDKVLKEIEFQQGKYVDVIHAVHIGKLLGAQQIIIGSCQISNNQIKAISRIVDVENGKIESTIEHIGSVEDVFNFQKEFTAQMTSKLK